MENSTWPGKCAEQVRHIHLQLGSTEDWCYTWWEVPSFEGSAHWSGSPLAFLAWPWVEKRNQWRLTPKRRNIIGNATISHLCIVGVQFAWRLTHMMLFRKLLAFLTPYFSMYVSVHFSMQSIQIRGLAASLGLYKWPSGRTILADVEMDRWWYRVKRYHDFEFVASWRTFFRPFGL